MLTRLASADGHLPGRPRTPSSSALDSLPSPVKFYKGGSQEKTLLRRPEFFLLPSPGDRARAVLTFRAIDSACGARWPSDLGFFYQRFSSPVATKPISSETRKAERWSGANHGSIGDSWPMAFSGCPRGPRVGWETRCPRRTVPNFTVETRSRTRVSRRTDGHRQRRSPRWSGSIRDTQAACGFRYWASKHTPFFQMCKVMAAILRASVRRAISGRIPLASSAV
jgi:hypothetical protein